MIKIKYKNNAGNMMFIKVTAEKFKSFDYSAKLTMISSSKLRKNNKHKTTIKNVILLKSAVIYGVRNVEYKIN